MTFTDFMSQEKKEGRGHANIELVVDASVQRLENYIQKRGGTGYSHQKHN